MFGLDRAREGDLRESDIMYWDQRLYERFFSGSEAVQAFAFMLSERTTTLSPGITAQHAYGGTFRIELGSEYCDIMVRLVIEAKGGDEPVEDTPYGLMQFGQVMSRSKKSGYSPSFHLIVREKGSLSDQLSALFTQVKAAGGAGVEVGFAIDVTSLLGKDAKSVWGNWGRANAHLPGRRAFPFNWLEFTADIR